MQGYRALQSCRVWTGLRERERERETERERERERKRERESGIQGRGVAFRARVLI